MPPGNDGRLDVPFKADMEQRLSAKIVTYEDGDRVLPGGMCRCCGSGPNRTPDWRGEPWYIYHAGLCDADGVYYSMLCEGCLEELREFNAQRPTTQRDEIARDVTELLGDDLDGAQSFMDDLGDDFGF